MRTKKRTLLTSKVYGFNPWMDQVTAINQMMETSGQKSEAPILRDLIDEALTARRRKGGGVEVAEQPMPLHEMAQTLETVKTLLLKLIGQEHTGLRAHGIGLALLQEILVEARAGRVGLWESLAVPALKERGESTVQASNAFDLQTDAAKDFAYGLAEEIRDEVNDSETDSTKTKNDDARPEEIVSL
jgi:hypothetical protein